MPARRKICGPRTFSLCALLCSGLRRSEQRPDLPNLCSHGPARLYVFAGPDPMLEIAVAVALGPARASCPTVHAASCPTRYRGLSARVTGSSPRSAPPGFGQIREPPVDVGLTHGVVSHSPPPPSRSSGGFMIPTHSLRASGSLWDTYGRAHRAASGRRCRIPNTCQNRPQSENLVKTLGSNCIQEPQPTRMRSPIDHQVEGRT
jgi:hypothetical protein